MSVLEFKNVSKSFGDGAARTNVLKDINLTVEDGEFLVLRKMDAQILLGG